MELCTSRAAKHRFGNTSDNRHFQMNNMNLQFRSMFDTEPTPAEHTSSRQRFAKQPLINGTHNLRTQPVEMHGTRDTNAQRDTSPLQKNCTAREQRQFTRAWRDATAQRWDSGKNGHSLLHSFSLPCEKHTLQPLSTSRVHAQSHSHNVGY